MGCLASILPRMRPWRRSLATVAAGAVIFVGNLARIAGSVGIGVLAGVWSLVLFHDWVGGVMTFVYTVSGFVVMLLVVLPKDPDVAAGTNEAQSTGSPIASARRLSAAGANRHSEISAAGTISSSGSS